MYAALAVIVIVLIVGSGWGAYLASKVPPPPGGAITTNSNGNTINNPSATALPISFSVLDKWAGGGVNAPTVTVYLGTQKTDSGAASSAGVYTTTGTYTPGETLNVEAVKSNSQQYYTVTVPSTASLVSSSNVYAITLNFWTLGTYSLSMVDNYGNTYAGASCFNFTSGTGSQCAGSSVAAKPGHNPAVLTVQIYDSVTNTGYVSSYDPINNVQWQAYLSISSAGAASISGFGSSVQRGSTSYYLTQVPDAGLQCVQVGQQISGCSTSQGFTVAPGSIAHGSSETETITLYGYFSTTWFAAQGTGSPNVVSLASTTIKLAK